MRIPVAGPWITDHEIDYVGDAIRTAWYSDANKFTSRFEQQFAAHVGRAHAISLPSCTSALHLALAAAGIGHGDEVIVPDLTWIASSAPITYVGAIPVFADVDKATWCLTPDAVESVLTERSKAVVVVDIYGGMPDMMELEALCQKHGIVLIEDAAEAIGSRYRGKAAGSFGQSSTFSFHGSKTLTTGEGGMLVTDDDRIYERSRILQDHGRVPGDTNFLNEEIAYKYKMSSLQAALGLAQLERIDELVSRKREIFGWYHDRLADVDGICLNHVPEHVENSFWMTTVVLEPDFGFDKFQLIMALGEQEIDARPMFSPLSSIPAYRDTDQARAARERNRIAYEITPYGVNLPSALNLDEKTVDKVCCALRAVLKSGRRPSH